MNHKIYYKVPEPLSPLLFTTNEPELGAWNCLSFRTKCSTSCKVPRSQKHLENRHPVSTLCKVTHGSLLLLLIFHLLNNRIPEFIPCLCWHSELWLLAPEELQLLVTYSYLFLLCYHNLLQPYPVVFPVSTTPWFFFILCNEINK